MMIRRFLREGGGGAAVEFALVLPLLIALLMAIVVYAGWFWVAQGVQTLASEAARAAIAGLDDTERLALVEDVVQAQAADIAALDPDLAVVDVQSGDGVIRVSISYDVEGHPVMALAGVLAPAPPRIIQRSASIRAG